MTVERFIGRVALFGLVVGMTLLALFVVMGWRTGKASHFALPKDVTTLFIGHSHVACGINDSLLPGTANCAKQGECHYYSYFKLRRLLEANPGVRNVVIDASNNQATERMDEWIWGDRYLQENYPHYALLMEPREQIFLFTRNPAAFASSLSEALRGQVSFLTSGSRDYLDHIHAKGFTSYDRVMARPSTLPGEHAQEATPGSATNTASLRKMIDLCHDRGVRVLLLRLPLHASSVDHRHDSALVAMLRSGFKDTELLDMGALTLPHDHFMDTEHTNARGARVISRTLGDLMRGGLMDRQDKQDMIDSAIVMVNGKVGQEGQEN